jgi:hypothetical protein
MEEVPGQAETEEVAAEEEKETVQLEGQPGEAPEEELEVPELGGQEEVQAAQRLKEVLGQGQGELVLDQEEPGGLQGL